jgi:hypothetical protein
MDGLIDKKTTGRPFRLSNELKLKGKSWGDQKPTQQRVQFKQRKLRAYLNQKQLKH